MLLSCNNCLYLRGELLYSRAVQYYNILYYIIFHILSTKRGYYFFEFKPERILSPNITLARLGRVSPIIGREIKANNSRNGSIYNIVIII